MADTKISALTDGVTANATDDLAAARAGANVRVTPGYIRTYIIGTANTWGATQTFGTINVAGGTGYHGDSTGLKVGSTSAFMWANAANPVNTADVYLQRSAANTVTLSSNGTTGAANLLVTGQVGYGSGAGGAVTQITSRSTGVTLNKASGAITLVSAVGSTTPTAFTVTNSTVAATDVVMLSQKSGTDKYILLVTNVAAGSFQITAYTTGGTTTETPVINFNVIKGVAA